MMSRGTVPKRKTGEPRFGNRSSTNWDNSVKTYKLSDEELKAYQNGEKGGSAVFNGDRYEEMKSKGMTNKEIAKEMGMAEPTLYKKKKAWDKRKNNQIHGEVKKKMAEKNKKIVNNSSKNVDKGENSVNNSVESKVVSKEKYDMMESQFKKKVAEYEKQNQLLQSQLNTISSKYENLEREHEGFVGREELERLKKQVDQKQELYDTTAVALENERKENVTLQNEITALKDQLNAMYKQNEDYLSELMRLQKWNNPMAELLCVVFEEQCSK